MKKINWYESTMMFDRGETGRTAGKVKVHGKNRAKIAKV